MMADSLLDLTVAELNVHAAQLAESQSEFDAWARSIGEPKDVAFELYREIATGERRTSAEQLAIAKTVKIYPEMAAKVASFLPQKHDKTYTRVGRPRNSFKAWVCAAAVFGAMTSEKSNGAAVAKAAARLGIRDQLDAVEKGYFRILRAVNRAASPSLLNALAKTIMLIDDIEDRLRGAAEEERRERRRSRHASSILAEEFATR